MSLSILFALLSAPGCGGAKEIDSSRSDREGLNAFLTKYERTFDPSKYGTDLTTLKHMEMEQRITLDTRNVFTTSVPETVAGYRAQILFTDNIEVANSVKDTLESLLPGEWCYVVYDAPYYKVRIGNFIDRNEATRMVRTLLSLGYKDPWIVPDNVIVNLPPLPPSIDIPADQRIAMPQ